MDGWDGSIDLGGKGESRAPSEGVRAEESRGGGARGTHQEGERQRTGKVPIGGWTPNIWGMLVPAAPCRSRLSAWVPTLMKVSCDQGREEQRA